MRWLPLVAVMAFGGTLAAPGISSGQSASDGDNTYGPLPAWLPKATVPVNRTLVASAQDPKLGIEGDTFKAVLPHGQTLITLAGPTVPPFVAPPPPTTTATFTISMSRSAGSVPIRPADFELVDGNGRIYYPKAFSGAPPPRVAPEGKTISFHLKEVMATGAGSVRWSPGGAPTASWDFTVEND